MRQQLGPIFYKIGFWGMLILLPFSAFLLFSGSEFDGRAVKLLFWLPFIPFWMFIKSRKWRDEGWWS